MSNARRGGKQISNPTMTTSKNIHKITTLKYIMKNKRIKKTSVHKYVNEISTGYWSHAILHTITLNNQFIVLNLLS